MNFTSTLYKNRSLIFAGLGIAGITATAVTAIWGQSKADKVVEANKYEINETSFFAIENGKEPYFQKRDFIVHDDLSTKERIKMTWKCYIPTILAGAATGICFFFAMKYTRIDGVKSFTPIPLPVEPKKVKQYFKEHVDQKPKEQITYDPAHQICIIETGHGDDLFFDAWTGRYFRSNRDFLKEQVDKFNYQIDNGPGWACLADYYKLIDLPSEGIDCVNRYYFDTERGYLVFDFGFNFNKGGENCTQMLFEDGPFDADTPELN